MEIFLVLIGVILVLCIYNEIAFKILFYKLKKTVHTFCSSYKIIKGSLEENEDGSLLKHDDVKIPSYGFNVSENRKQYNQIEFCKAAHPYLVNAQLTTNMTETDIEYYSNILDNSIVTLSHSARLRRSFLVCVVAICLLMIS